MIRFLRTLFTPKPKGKWHFFAAVSKRDKSGRWRHAIYVDGKRAKESGTWSFWFKRTDNDLTILMNEEEIDKN